jgi:hypothetical protein
LLIIALLFGVLSARSVSDLSAKAAHARGKLDHRLRLAVSQRAADVVKAAQIVAVNAHSKDICTTLV